MRWPSKTTGNLSCAPASDRPQAVIARQHRAARQFVQQGEQLVIAKPFHITRRSQLRQHLPRLQKSDGPRALAANMIQQRKIVLARHLKLLGNQAPHLPFGQQTGKERPGLVIVKGFNLQCKAVACGSANQSGA